MYKSNMIIDSSKWHFQIFGATDTKTSILADRPRFSMAANDVSDRACTWIGPDRLEIPAKTPNVVWVSRYVERDTH